MDPQKKVSIHQQTQQEQIYNQQQAQPATLEFETVEELLRHDALHTPVPPVIARRLEDSVTQLPQAPRRSWWRRLLGGWGS
jgi:hypothetical protein